MARKQGKRRRRGAAGAGISSVKKTPQGTEIKYRSGTTIKWVKGSQKPQVTKRRK